VKEKQVKDGLDVLRLEFGDKKVKDAIDAVKRFRVEVPSWIFGAFGGGRFGEYTPPGAARNISEKLDDASYVNKLTGVTDRVAMHILWDLSTDGYYGSLEQASIINKEAKQRGVGIGAISPTYFIKGSHRGSFSSDDKQTRQRYIEQTVLGAKIAREYGSKMLTLWFPDGSLYPGQVELGRAYKNVKESLIEAYKNMPKDITILIEYKVFEPGTYSTVVSDWASSYILCKNLGTNVGVLVDLGHHHHGTNIEQIVARLIQEGMKCGFHFNTRYAADDDHSVEPNAEMARIFYELVNGDVVVNKSSKKNWAYMIDQCSGRENRLHAILHSLDSLQLSLAKAMLVDRDLLAKYQDGDEIILANRVFNDALLNADVRPVVAKARIEKGLPSDPMEAYIKSGYQKKIESKRR